MFPRSSPDKLLYMIGKRPGNQKKHFRYPRGLAISEEGHIYIADTMNHRIQKFNQCGVFLGMFGSKGEWNGEFNEPSAVAVTVDGDLAVADRKNKRIQVLQTDGQQLFEFATKDEPFGALRVGPEGHLVDLEFTSNGNHCAKIFRYGICDCHPISPVNLMRSMATTPMTA
ncbi:hypothetical protein CAPTEDRAFT_95559 [Capitella teleta]|uniref:Peptidylamidoglycolate lyase n=1 Tax=Capitella teleta TaxID=283909 RepID=R7T6M2_CAPTE|nr:hypothetical protein CAPTEDRAFT_95559 [Capitella teleta]|eukprot:ELT89013.1 hypothetical protein CAPTEDRAFT_95559 [Capitella teleta]